MIRIWDTVQKLVDGQWQDYVTIANENHLRDARLLMCEQVPGFRIVSGHAPNWGEVLLLDLAQEAREERNERRYARGKARK